MDLIQTFKNALKGKNFTVVLPEGEDERVVKAARILKEEGIVKPLVLTTNFDLEGLEVIKTDGFDISEMSEKLVERRNGKMDKAGADKILKRDANYFGTMLLYMGKAQGLVSGANHSTADTVRPALQIIKMKKPFTKTSGVFVMMKGDERYIFSDCAININPSSQDLAENAVLSAQTAKVCGIEEPRVALLSFSTKGSASSEETEKVIEALRLVKEMDPSLIVDGEMQFDAAFVKSVGEKKAPGSPVAGRANVFIFPTLDAGNIGYKIAQRMGGFEAVGPILQGLNHPMNDLSRGCSVEDIVSLSYLTLAQAL